MTSLLEYGPVSQPLKALFEMTRGTPIIPQIKMSYFAVALILFYFAVWFVGIRSRPSAVNLFSPVLLFYFTFTDPYPQYLVWVLPLLTLDVVLYARRHLKLFAALLALMFGWGFLAFATFSTPSGYSLFLIQLVGGIEPLPWYSQAMQALLFGQTVSVLITPWLRATLAATSLVYALAILRGWI